MSLAVRAIPALLLLLVPTVTPAAPATLPDSVVARTPRRDLTVTEVRSSWLRLDPKYRPAGEGDALKRAFVEQLLEKEAMAQAALAEPFVMTQSESAKFVAYRENLARNALIQLLIADSAVVEPVDRDSARARMTTPPDGGEIPAAAIESAAKDWAQRRRAQVVEARMKAALAPAFDDAVAADLAGAYAALDSTPAPGADPLQTAIRSRWPKLTAADSLRVLARSTAGDLSVGEFVRRFSMLNPFNTPLPKTAGIVKARGEQFLGQIWFEAEIARRRMHEDPNVLALAAERRESIALDHWYRRHVGAAIDTSEAALRAHYATDPSRYGVAAHAIIRNWPVPTRATADSLVAALAAGAPWDSVCARVALGATERDACGETRSVTADAADSALVANLAALEPGRAYVRDEPEQGLHRVVQLVNRNPARVRPFEEARTFVVRDLAARQAEDILVARMAAARKALVVTVNDRAIARLALEP